MSPARIVKIDMQRPGDAYGRCREVVAAGGVVAYPTDTFYGLGADPRSERAVRNLFEIKGRSSTRPILLLVADATDVREWVAGVPGQAVNLMERFWPGPLTIVFPASPDALPLLTAGTGSIGIRVPGEPVTRGLLRYLGHALTGTSANRAGEPENRTADGVARALGDRIDLILDGGETAGGKPSTIVDVRGGSLRVLREGAIPAAALIAGSSDRLKSEERTE